jgi:hypothetical protein
MEKKNAMSLKAKIRNIAKSKSISAQVVLQNYFFERFLDRLSQSEYQDKFILKGGFLIAAMVGLDARGTIEKISNISDILKSIEESSMLKNQWKKYQQEYSYAKGVTYEDTIKAIKGLVDS